MSSIPTPTISIFNSLAHESIIESENSHVRRTPDATEEPEKELVAFGTVEDNPEQTQLGGETDHDPAVRAARAALKRAQIALSHAVVYAPADGWIANLSLRPGDVITTGQSLFSIVEKNDWWVTANFKETALSRIRAGQPASITVDMYPDMKLTGTVASLGMGSGAIFSLLPPENATGNWVHVTQRFPVRIHLDYQPSPEQEQHLRAGSSVTATVDTTELDTAND